MKRRILWNLLFIFTLVIAIVTPVGVARAGSPDGPDAPRAVVPLTDPDPEALEESDWLAQAFAYIEASEYHLSQGDGSWSAPNRAQDLRATFSPAGLQLVRRTEREPSWTWDLALVGFGRDGAMVDVDAPTMATHENRITYQRGRVTERYTNATSGLEQTISLAAPPFDRAAGPLFIDLAFAGGLTPHRSADGGLEFRHDGEAVLRYDDLRATDATARPVPAHVDITTYSPTPNTQYEIGNTPSVLRLTLDDSSVIYPIHIHATITGLPNSSDWVVEGDAMDMYFGESVATAGDVNGDGYSDVIVGAPNYDGQASDMGAAFVFRGSPTGLSTIANWSIHGDAADERLGYSVATAGDVNGDGYSDVIIGVPGYRSSDSQINEGAALVFHGSSAGLSATADWVAEVNQAEAYLGYSVATAGDVNGDGYSDVVAGAPTYDAYAYDDDRGMAVVWLGGSGGLQDAGTPSWFEFGPSAGERYGHSVASAGDVNGDGYADLIVGAPENDSGHINGGRAYVYHGAAEGLNTSRDWIIYGPLLSELGTSVSTAGDVNGDGYADVIVGVPYYDGGQTNEGQARVYHGSATGLSDTLSWSVERNVAGGALYGWSVATAGDVNGDGYADVIVGAPYYGNGEHFEGEAQVYHGSAGGLLSTAAWTTESDATEAHYGMSVATAGDVNGDGYSDVIIGAPQYTNDQDDEGMAFAFYGGPDNLSQTAGWDYESDSADKNLGWSVSTAGDVNGDGYADVMAGAPYYDSGQTDEGAVFLWHGSEQGPATAPDWAAYSDQADAQLGYALSTAGDVNGDGYADVLVGAPYYSGGQSEEGTAFIWYGGSAGMGSDGLPSNADWTAEGDTASLHLGQSVSTAGDVNADGYADVAAGAPNYANGNTDEGAVFVWHGSSGGLGASGTPANADWHDEGDADSAFLGTSVSTAGDVNRDGYSDLIAGGANFATVWHGSSSGLNASTTDWTQSGSGLYGYSVDTAGDVDGDGYSDVIVGAPFYANPDANEGGAWAYCGSSGGLGTSACWTDEGGEASAYFGWSVATAGDVNGDGYADIVAGAPYWADSHSNEGQARVYYGSSGGPISYNGGDWTGEGNMADAALGYSVATAGDVNGDGYADVLLGAPGYNNGQSDEGQVSLYYGNGQRGVSLFPRQLRTDGISPIAPLGLSNSQTSFRVQGTIWSPTGRGEAQLQWEVKPLASLFDATGLVGTPWLDTGTDGLTVQGNASGLTAGTIHHWRVRTKYNPVDHPFAPPYSRWVHMPWNGWNEADLLTAYTGAGAGTCASPLSLSCGEMVSGDTSSFTNNISTYGCQSGWDESGPEAIYGFTLGGGGTYEVTAQLSAMSADLDVFLLAAGGCETGQCLTSTSSGDTTATASGVPAGTYYVAVDGYNGASGSYNLRLTCTSSSGNSPPNVPGNPSPADLASDVNWNPTLSWTGGDPDGDTVNYTVFGQEAGSSFSLVWYGPDVNTSCALSSLRPDTTYEWAVSANDGNGGITMGPDWEFTTALETVYLPLVMRD
jgi:hypothetical protein